MVEKVVDYKVKYKGETDIDIINGKVYQCVMECYEDGELFTIGVVDESGEYYQYDPGDFDIVPGGLPKTESDTPEIRGRRMREKTKFKTKKLNYKARYIGPETLDITPGEIYQVIGEIIEPEGQAGYLGVIDESGDSYVYHPSLFEKVE